MNVRNLVLGSAALAATAALSLVALPAHAAPPSQGCPDHWQLLSVAVLHDLGYRVPDQVDSPDNRFSFGHLSGNGDGLVCGVALGNQSFNGNQIYDFMDNSLTGG